MKCRCANTEAVQRTVMKNSANKGRLFWTCPARACGFFEWDKGDTRPPANESSRPQQSSRPPQQSSRPPQQSFRPQQSSRPPPQSSRPQQQPYGRQPQPRNAVVNVGQLSSKGFGWNRNKNNTSSGSNQYAPQPNAPNHHASSSRGNPFGSNPRIRNNDGSSSSIQSNPKRIRIGGPSHDSSQADPSGRGMSAVTFDLSTTKEVGTKVNPTWQKDLIDSLKSVGDDVTMRNTNIPGVQEVLVPYKLIGATRQILLKNHNKRMVFSFPEYIVERLEGLQKAHEVRERGGDQITQPLNEILPVAICKALMDFQWEGIHFALRNGGRVLIGDDMGLGKTLQAISVARIYMNDWPLLIVCPSSLRINWKEELLMWLSDDISENDILVIMKGSECETPLRKINIVSYDLIRKVRTAKLQKCGFIICDESHYLKSRQAKRTQTVAPLVKRAKRALLLSGTPALSRPVELYTQVNALVPLLFPNFTEYAERYCNAHHGRFGYDTSGSSNLGELHTLLRASVLIRRKKDDVLTQLPAKRRQVQYVETTPKYKNELKKAFKKLGDMKNRTMGATGDDAQVARNMERKVQTELYSLSGISKLKSILEVLKETHESGVKFIVFAHHQDVMDGIEEFLRLKLKIGFIRIDGNTAQASRQGLCKSFQEDPKVRVSLLSITAAGVGLTLTAATVVLFAELYWNPGSLIQAEDRAHRIGQRDCVMVKYLLAKGTYDESMWSTVKKKFNVIGKSLTGMAATIEVASQTPVKAEEDTNDPILDVDEDEKPTATADDGNGNSPTQNSVKRTIDLTQDVDDYDDDAPILVDTPPAKKNKKPITLDQMFPDPDKYRQEERHDEFDPEVELVDDDIKLTRLLQKYYGKKKK